MSVDPLADKYPGWNPYNYTLNNPVRLIDPDGRAVASITGGPDDPPTESEVYYQMSKELQGVFASLGSLFDNLYSSITNVFEHPYNKNIKTSITTTTSLNIGKAIMDIRQVDKNEVFFGNEPFVKKETKIDALYYETEQKMDIPLNKILSAGISVKQKISVDNGAATLKVKETLGVKKGAFSGGGFISGSIDSNQKTTLKMGVELKANSPKVTSTIQFGIKLDDQ